MRINDSEGITEYQYQVNKKQFDLHRFLAKGMKMKASKIRSALRSEQYTRKSEAEAIKAQWEDFQENKTGGI